MTTIQLDHLIVGAGIAGLTYARSAQKKGRKVLLLEANDRPGGVIRSERKQGFLLEHGPNTVMASPDLLSLVDELGLSDQLILADMKIPRYILLRQKLQKAPLSPLQLLSTNLLSVKGKLRLLQEPFIQKREKYPDESLAGFIRRRLGREVADHLAAPFISGVWAGDIEQLSAQAAFPKLAQWEKESGSLFRGIISDRKKKANAKESSSSPSKYKKGLMSFKEGLETLPRALATSLGQNIFYKSSIQRIEKSTVDSKSGWRVTAESGIYECKNLVFATPAFTTAGFIEPFAPCASEALNRIPYAPLVIMHLSARKGEVGHPLEGFGYLVAPQEREPILGCLWNSSVFQDRAPVGSVLLTVFLGGTRQPELYRETDNALVEKVEKSIKQVLELKDFLSPLSIRRYEKAIPQYNIGHFDLVQKIREAEIQNPGLSFTGNYLEGISMGDVIRQSKKAFETSSPFSES